MLKQFVSTPELTIHHTAGLNVDLGIFFELAELMVGMS